MRLLPPEDVAPVSAGQSGLPHRLVSSVLSLGSSLWPRMRQLIANGAPALGRFDQGLLSLRTSSLSPQLEDTEELEIQFNFCQAGVLLPIPVVGTHFVAPKLDMCDPLS
jgi:hypothetical protein